MNLDIVRLEIPERLDDSPVANRFREYVSVRNAVWYETWGTDEFAISDEECLGYITQNSQERQHIYVALSEGQVVGFARADVSLYEPQAPAYADVYTHPLFRRRGVGAALAECIDVQLREEGRSSTQTWKLHRPAAGPQLVPPTGAGSIPADDDSVRFLQRRGFSLEQIERTSELVLDEHSRARFVAARDSALPHATDYAVRTWAGYTPSDQLENLADLYARMSTDAPSGGLDVEPETWNAERLAKYEKILIEGRRQDILCAAAFDEHGKAVAFTTFGMQSGGRPAFQDYTLVHADHRGHRLGMLVKAENLLQLLDTHPSCQKVVTWNAEENRHMLAVNEALGFTAVMSEGAWQCREGWTA